MRCRTCDYRLWNLPARRCPECGTPFKPSDYEFTINSVQFRCPHCGQSYYGTGERGHLVPIEFDCVGCGRHIHMDETVLFPTEGVQEEQTKVESVPWMERKERGRVRTWFTTVGMALVRPARLMEMLPEEDATGSAVLFGVIATCVAMLGFVFPFFVFPLIFAFVGAGGGAGLFMPIGLVIFFVAAAAVVFALTCLWGLVIHGLLRLTGDTAGGIDRTYQAVFYGTGANVCSGIPCLGFYVGWIWWLVSTVLMVRQRQNVSTLRAVFAAVTPLVTFIGTVAGLYVWLIVFVLSTMPTTMPAGAVGTMPAGPFTTSVGLGGPPIRVVATALRDHAAAHGGAGPGHATELVARGHLIASDLIAPGSSTKLSDAKVGESTLEDFLPDETGEILKAAQAAARDLPPGTVAHRVGDYIFTHHGIKFTEPPPPLWVVVEWPDPVANRPLKPNAMVQTAFADGTVVLVAVGEFSASLADQNKLRKEYELLPLPDLSGITHAKPAVVGKQSN